ncbi:hypothetical protein, partial [Pyramidobacter sp. CG50-2]|uniref:hypothetical protein n=1 Tax=Pyramidobacter sp. CG50-2 TaxID=2382160 RepID=UPI001F47FE60
LAVVDVPDRSDVQMGLAALKFLFCHWCGLPKTENFRALQGPLIENQACVISPATASQRTVADSFFLRSSRRLHRDAGGEAADERSAFRSSIQE